MNADAKLILSDMDRLLSHLRENADRAQLNYLNACIRCEQQRILMPWLLLGGAILLTLLRLAQ